jgi:benzoyl-CoA reductase/2-hydroxyglutaryl-CoA dehydratase subunit BcrC/BadD/HgdB
MEERIDFRRWAGPIENDSVREWKAGGGRVAGFFCANAPEEVLWAAGILPLRMRGTGSEDTSTADQYFGPVNCGFVRHTLNRVASGELAFLDGLLLTNSCDHLRRLSDICIDKQLAPFCHYVDVPHVNSESSRTRLVAQLRALKERLESAFGVTISDEKLAGALKLYNRTRLLLSRASRLRADNPPRITGSEVLAMSVAAASMPKDQFNALLERRLGQIEAGNGVPASGGPRLLIIGGALDDPGYLEVIESLGASVVADQLCWGSKTFSEQAVEGIDPLEAIARRMLDHTPCPRMLSDYPKRLASISEAVQHYRVDGIICERLKFCDLWGGEVEMLRHSVKEKLQLPFLVLERDYLAASSVGQLRTRVQAFLETLA